MYRGQDGGFERGNDGLDRLGLDRGRGGQVGDQARLVEGLLDRLQRGRNLGRGLDRHSGLDRLHGRLHSRLASRLLGRRLGRDLLRSCHVILGVSVENGPGAPGPADSRSRSPRGRATRKSALQRLHEVGVAQQLVDQQAVDAAVVFDGARNRDCTDEGGVPGVLRCHFLVEQDLPLARNLEARRQPGGTRANRGVDLAVGQLALDEELRLRVEQASRLQLGPQGLLEVARETSTRRGDVATAQATADFGVHRRRLAGRELEIAHLGRRELGRAQGLRALAAGHGRRHDGGATREQGRYQDCGDSQAIAAAIEMRTAYEFEHLTPLLLACLCTEAYL
ncbi:hypothetical protein RA210_U50001 [Rubrivivax sp. A210]|nr:hypothetical protein RA210_U50001 [Rubrivivax sp. A210]